MLLVLITGLSYAKYEKVDEIPFINARVGAFKENDIQLAMKLDGEQVEAPPEKNSLYTVTVDCDNATGIWDMNLWGATITNISAAKVKCEVNFSTPEPTLSSINATAEKTSISLSYTAGGIGTSTTCEYGTDTNYGSTVEGSTNTNCNITGIDYDTIYYYKVCAINGAGETCKEGNAKTKKQVDVVSDVEVGNYISMTPTATTYTISTDLTGYSYSQTIKPSELNLWRVIRKNSDGTVDMVSDKVSSTLVYFSGEKGYLNLVGGLNTIAAQYTNRKHVVSTRHMGYSDQKLKCYGSLSTKDTENCDTDTGYTIDLQLVNVAYGGSSGCIKSCPGLKAKKVGTTNALRYWIASRWYYDGDSGESWSGREVGNDGTLSGTYLYRWLLGSGYGSGMGANAVRPIVTLKSTSEILSGEGTKSSPFTLS